MRIDELSVGSGIQIQVYTGADKPLLFESRIIEVLPKKRLVLIDAIIQGDKVLSFRAKNIKVDIVASVPDDKPYLFKNVTLETLKSADNTYCYNIICLTEGIPYNRRENFRHFVGTSAMLRGTNLSEEYEVIVRDVSSTGFSVTCGSDLDLTANQLVHVLFEDYLEEIDEEFKFHFYGIVVRKQELEPGRYVYGCRLNNHVGGLENYLNKKERIRIRKTRNF